MPRYKTPGVYVTEQTAFPNSVVEVPTSVPVFIGYTEHAQRGTADLHAVPTRLASLADYTELFGGGCTKTIRHDGKSAAVTPDTQFHMHAALRLFFDNGGGPVWIVSVGGYVQDGKPRTMAPADYDAAFAALENVAEPAIVVLPDAVLLPSAQDCAAVQKKALAHCGKMQSRVAILDVFNGDTPRTFDAKTDVISGTGGFRALIGTEALNYGACYYPWLNTSLFTSLDATFQNLTPDSLTVLKTAITAEFASASDMDRNGIKTLVADLTPNTPDATQTHKALLAISKTYQKAMTEVLRAMNVLPPSGGIAGVYARTDTNCGVFKAPANTGILSAVSPTVSIPDGDQADLNTPPDGLAVNAIRAFSGQGLLIWGARTLDGNSADFRYVNVRRTLIMLEHSIMAAARAYVFAPNDASTWTTVRAMTENFLTNQWKSGALAGATSNEAYQVDVGPGSTMTADDDLNGYMRLVVKVAIMRPAEFIVITIQQRMQTS